MNLTPSAATKRPPEIVLRIEKPAWRTSYFRFGPDNSHEWTTHRHEAFHFTEHAEASRIASDYHGHVVACETAPEASTHAEHRRRSWLPYKDSPED